MGTTSPFKDHHQQHRSQLHHPPGLSLTKKLIPWSLYALLPIALLRFYFYPNSQIPLSPPQPQSILISTATPSSPPPPPLIKESESKGNRKKEISSKIKGEEFRCEDYTSEGEWVRSEAGPLYNGTSCGVIKDGQNCLAHGRPNRDYLHHRWKPRGCSPLPPFQPLTFLSLLRHRHVAFVGDSMARNQLESLLCLLSSSAAAGPPKLLRRSGEDNKFRKWLFPSQNVTFSIYWSPFLVRGTEKSAKRDYNELFLEKVDPTWAKDLHRIDTVVLSVGHWFLHPAVYYDEGRVLGCHYCPGTNLTEIGFYGVFAKAVKTALNAVIGEGRGGGAKEVIVTTFSPAHFEGEWDKAGACPKTAPYKEGEMKLQWMDAEMRRAVVAEVQSAAAAGAGKVRVEALDVTKLALMRPDGHPGPYMHPNPFTNGPRDRVQNDCVHWCLPGPVDTWNEILLQVIKRWRLQSRTQRR